MRVGKPLKNIIIKTEGMTCGGCEAKIENNLKKQSGIIDVKANSEKNIVSISFEEDKIDISTILSIIEKLHYSAKVIEKNEESERNINKFLGIGILILALYMIIKYTIGFNFVPKINQNMSYGMLFVIGLITSLHCMAMCGGINLSQCMRYNDESEKLTVKDKVWPSLLYNMGRLISYAAIGAIVGSIGNVLSLGGNAQGMVSIIAGIFMLIFGIKMLDIFPSFKKFSIRIPKFFANKIYSNNKNRGPFYIGLLNGFMPCGPLQTMQLYALGTGSFIAGGMSMFFFALGTIPLMFRLGFLSTILSSKFTKNMMKASAVLVIVLSLIMLNRGLILIGFELKLRNPTILSEAPKNTELPEIIDGVQIVNTTLTSGSKYPNIIIQKEIPVKWTISAEKKYLNGCNNEIVIPKYDVKKKLFEGDNIIEFTPNEVGTITYSCWMGMIVGNIKVVETTKNI